MTAFIRVEGWERGGWRPWKHPSWPGPILHDVAALTCPTCGSAFVLSPAVHTIAPDGSVSPSILCPRLCGFHVFATLVGWSSLKIDQ